jgi:nucleoside-diphosphate-sugar epimerase
MGSATLAMLDAALDSEALRRRVRVFGSVARDIGLPSGTVVRCEALTAMPHARVTEPIVLHYAYATKDKLGSLSEAVFVETNARIQALVTEAIAAWRPAGVFFPSSGAVYGADGALVATPVQNLYGWMKRCDEENLSALAAQFGTRLRIARIFTLSGEHINKTAIYALACFLSDVRSGKAIRIHAGHRVIRSYAYVGDVVNLALASLFDDTSDGSETRLTFDVAGPEVVEMGELAELCRVVCARPDLPILRPPIDATREDRMVGDPAGYDRLLRMYGMESLPLREQVRATGRWLGAC